MKRFEGGVGDCDAFQLTNSRRTASDSSVSRPLRQYGGNGPLPFCAFAANFARSLHFGLKVVAEAATDVDSRRGVLV